MSRAINVESGRPTPAMQYLLVFLLAVLPYLLLLGKPLLHDGPRAIVDNPAVQSGSLAKLWAVDFWGAPLDAEYSSGSYRPLVSTSYALQAKLLGNGAWLFHLVDMVLHALAALLLLILLGVLGIGRWRLAAAALFAVHPVQTEALSSGIGRADILAAICLFGALILHLRAADDRARWSWDGVALVLLAAGLFCKEYAVAFPFILIAAGWARGGDRRRLAVVWTGALLILGGYLSLRFVLMGSVGGVPMLTEVDHPLYGQPVLARWATAARLVVLAARLLFFPHSLNHFYRYGTLPIVESFLHPLALMGVVLVILGVGGAVVWRIRGRESIPLIGAALLVLPLAPSLNTVSLAGVLFAERFLYIPCAGLALLVGWLGDRYLADRWRNLALGACGVVLLVFAGLTAWRVQDWSSDESLARSSLRGYPDSSEVRLELALALAHQDRFDEAREQFERAIEIHPDNPRIWKNYAVALIRLGRFDDAARAWRRTVELSPPDIGVLWRGLAEAEVLAGNLPRGIEAYRRAVALIPNDSQALLGLGQTLLKAGDAEAAVQLLRANVESLPQGREAGRMLLGQALLRLGQARLAAGHPGEALELAREAVAGDFLPPEGLYLAGLIASRVSDAEQARLWFEAALARAPDLLQKKHQAALRLEAAGHHDAAAAQLQEVLVSQPDHVSTLFNLGRMLLLAGKPDQAVAPLTRGLALQEDARARGLLAEALRASGSRSP